MEFCNGWNRGYALAAELRKLLTLRRVDVDKAVHVTYAEALHAVLRILLPLRSQSRMGIY
jgi:hypothetical protein